MNLKDELVQVIDALASSAIPYALCGGMAVIVHGYPRLTKDIDLLIREQDLDRSRSVLKQAGYTIESGVIPFDLGKPTERRVFRVTKIKDQEFLTVDLVLVNPLLEDVWSGREAHEAEGKLLSVVSLEGLARMKRLAGRPQDLADLFHLGLEGGSP